MKPPVVKLSLCYAAARRRAPKERAMATAGVALPEVRVQRLDNGLDLLFVQDADAPVFTLEVWYRVGSADEREAGPDEDHGLTGLSHFFEHLMFRGTERNPDFFDAVYARGGQLNAWTWLDATCYWEKLPREHLRFALEAEADRMAHMALDFLSLEPEREVVKSERLLRTDNDPSGAASEVLHALAYRRHPYRWPTVGWMRDLNCITLEEARDYYRPRYAPSNAFVVLVGDLDFDEALLQVEETFGRIPAGDPLPERDYPAEPPQSGVRRGRAEKPVTSPLFQLAWHGPAGRDEAFVALEVLHYLLVRGKSGRLQRALVYGDDPVATSLSASLFPLRDPYLYVWEVSVRPGRSPREAEARLLQEIERLIAEPPSEREVRRSVNGLSADIVRAGLTTQGKADNLGFSYLVTGDPLEISRRLERYPDVTPEDVRATAQRWLAPERRTVVAATDPAAPAALVAEWAGEEPAPDAALLLEAMAYAGRRTQVAGQAEELDGEALAVDRLEERWRRVRDTADEALAKTLDGFREDDDKGPAQRGILLEQARADSAEARLELERHGEDLRAGLDALDAPGPPAGRAVRAAAEGYLGREAPDALAETLTGLQGDDAAVFGLLLGHLHDLAGDEAAAGAAYAAVEEGRPPGEGLAALAGDLAWERRRGAEEGGR